MSNGRADSDGSIAAYIAALRAQLRGPARYKASLVAEARDGLHDAAEAYRADGLDDATAQRKAVADFGRLPEVLPAYQAELGVAQGRRVAVMVAVGSPLMQVSSGLLWRYQAPAGEWRPPPAYLLLADVVDIGAYVMAAAAVLALLGFGVGSRYFGGARLARAVAAGSLAATTATLLAGFALAGFSPHMAVTWPVVVQSVASYAAFGWVTWAAVRCLAIMPARGEPRLADCRGSCRSSP